MSGYAAAFFYLQKSAKYSGGKMRNLWYALMQRKKQKIQETRVSI